MINEDDLLHDVEEILDEESHHSAVELHLQGLLGVPKGAGLSVSLVIPDDMDMTNIKPWQELHGALHQVMELLLDHFKIQEIVQAAIIQDLILDGDGPSMLAASVLSRRLKYTSEDDDTPITDT